MKKVLKSVILTLCMVFVLFSFSGCSLKGVFGSFEDYVALFDLLSGNVEPVTPIPEERVVGDFVVWFYEDENNSYCEIKGTSEQGNEKPCLIIPEQIDGVRVKSLGIESLFAYFGNFGVSPLAPPEIESDVLERIYFEGITEVSPFYILSEGIKAFNFRPDIVLTNLSEMYIPREFSENINFHGTPAKVSYYYNYENEKGKYYWIDDYDYGSKIKYAPPTPTREGYVFDGWYKESECINKWDFDEDTLPEEKTQTFTVTVYGTDENGEPFPIERERTETVFQETILYAKWIQE